MGDGQRVAGLLGRNLLLPNRVRVLNVGDGALELVAKLVRAALKIQFPIWITNFDDKNKILKHKPEAYLSYLFSDQGKNSIREKLVSKYWIFEIDAGVVNDISDMVEFEI